jgi:carboxymethylenebutenolidase
MGVIRDRIIEKATSGTSGMVARGLAPVLAAIVLLAACRGSDGTVPMGSPRATMSDAGHGASAAAVDAMDMLSADALPDTELHLQLSAARPPSPDDSTRADMLLVDMRDALRKYTDVRVAAADGFEEMPGPAGKHRLHHLSNWAWARAESRRFDPAKPTSLLYREDADGTLRLAGAMYTAPANASPEELDQRLPVSFARWHRHVNWCTPGTGSGSQWLATRNGAPLYGPRSPVVTRDACTSQGGIFYPQVFGWMVHVTLVGSDDPAVVWRGANSPDTATQRVAAVAPDTMRHVLAAAPGVTPASGPAAAVAPTPAATSPSTPAAPLAARSRALIAAVPVVRRQQQHPASVVTADTITPPGHPHPASDVPGRTVFSAPVTSAGTFRSGAATVAYDRFEPAGHAGHRPGVVLLHDAPGLAPQAAFLHTLAMTLVQRGYEVEIVHYLDRSGMVAADGDDRRAHFREWAGTVRDALSDLARSPGVDSSRLGVMGTGLGGTLALTAAATDPRVKAVAEYGGAIPSRAASLVQRMPPVLIMHGDKDHAVPLMEAYRIRAMCQAVQAPTEFEVFYGQSHVIEGADADALRDKTVAFLNRYLGQR